MGERSTSRCPRKNGVIPSSLWCEGPFGRLDSSRRCSPANGEWCGGAAAEMGGDVGRRDIRGDHVRGSGAASQAGS